MAIKLKENLLSEIFAPNQIDKYSKSVLNLKTLIELEQKEEFELPKELLNRIKEILKKEDNFLNNIPLKIVEYYFNLKISNINSFINIIYKNYELSIKTNELLIILEDYYNQIFLVSSMLANYYNLEIKINTESNNDYA